jgi:hypothetical protein
MNRFRNKIFKIKIDGFPLKEKAVKTSWHAYISFGTGTLLAISESMPFINNEYNGVLHALSKIQQEYIKDFK